MSVVVEYRVVWKRVGLRRKSKRYARQPSATMLLALLQASPAAALTLRGEAPDAYFCCNGYMCGCGGVSKLGREQAYYAGLPKLEWCRLEERTIGEWRAATACPKCGEP